MLKWTQALSRWLPAVLVMVVIFLFSAQPSSNLPDFDWLDRLVKKGGHMIGYALVALSYWRGLGYRREKRWLAWILALAYAASDEFHQSFVPGRSPSIVDILIFDNLGALVSLWIAGKYWKQKRPGPPRPIVRQPSR
jgi:VanZ family protein